MMSKYARILMLAAAPIVLLGSALLASGSGALPALQGLAAEAGSAGPVIHLYANGDLETVHYSPQPGVWVVEMPEAAWAEGVGLLSEPGLGIERAELEHVEEFGKRVTRLTVWLVAPAQLQLMQRANGIDLEFSSSSLPAASAAAEVKPEVKSEDAPVTPAAAEPATQPAAEPAAPAAPGVSLLEVVPVRSGEGLMIELRGDGPLAGRAFTLSGPERLVVDLPGVVNRVQQTLYPIGSSLVRQVRVAQFRSVPDPVARVVVDLEASVEYRLETSSSGAKLLVGLASESKAVPAVASNTVAEPGAAVINNLDGPISVTRAQPPTAEPTAAAVSEEHAPPTLAEPPAPEPMPAEPPSAAPARSPWVADPSQLIERAPAAQVVQSQPAQGDTYASKEVTNEEQRYTGEPITLTLKDADIKDVLRTFSTLTNLNIVVDPGVSGSVTVELRNVPWDQALDLILKINNLGYVLENNVLRVSTQGKLASEKKATADLAKEQERSQPLKTVTKPLSYAKATEVVTLLKTDSYLMSDRGSVVVDNRTNTLIIRDTVDRVEGILRLIDQLDTPTPQVVIEGRIVESTRQFAHRLGVDWGFTGVANAAHGNDTGLVFPNNGSVDGRVNLGRAYSGNIGFTFGDILDTFNLDFMLMAGETNGLVKIVSTPRVTTQNLKRATIRSGLQIPIQTVANNTVTVQYVDATLNLDVLPQITAEGTVDLDLTIKKQEPVTATTGATNAPIFTRDAKTDVLVRDGGTTVIGGIYQLSDTTNNDSVPGLAKIPILGYLFKNKELIKRHDELLIFVTPRIVKY